MSITTGLTLANCASLQGSYAGSDFISDKQASLHMDAGFNAPEMLVVSYNNPSEYEEYARIHESRDEQSGAVAEWLLSTSIGTQTALEIPEHRMRKLNASWMFNQAPATLQYDRVKSHVIDDKTYRYQRFTHTYKHMTRQCTSFVHSWDYPPDDPMARPSQSVFGYYCAKLGQSLDDGAVRQLLASLDFHTDKKHQGGYGKKVTNNETALQAAQGQDGRRYGNAGFPFQFTRYYSIGGDDLVP